MNMQEKIRPEACPKCGGPSHACEAECLHCDAESCIHVWFPGQPDTSPQSYKRHLRGERAPIDLITGPTRLAEIQRRLETRGPCDDDADYHACPGWRIDEADGDPQRYRIGELFIARCDACAADLITDDDAALIPEAQDELARLQREAAQDLDVHTKNVTWFERGHKDPRGIQHPRPLAPNTGNEGQAIRRVAATIFIETDAELIDVAKSIRKILDDADCFGYQLGVAEVQS